MDVLWLQLTFYDPHVVVHTVINCVNYIGLVCDSLLFEYFLNNYVFLLVIAILNLCNVLEAILD